MQSFHAIVNLEYDIILTEVVFPCFERVRMYMHYRPFGHIYLKLVGIVICVQ